MGFTLIELMVASVLLGLTVSAVAIMIVNASVMRLVNDHFRQARIIAQEELEDPVHHYFNYDGLGSIVNGAISLDFNEPAQAPTPAFRNLTLSVQTQTIAGTLVPFKTMASNVSWSENGQNFTVTMAKRVTKVR